MIKIILKRLILIFLFFVFLGLVSCTIDHTHAYTQTITLPTCNAQGFTKHKCSCGHVYYDDYTEKLEHNYNETLYVWAEDFLFCTATAICEYCNDKITENASSSYSVVKESSVTECGVGIYSVSFENLTFVSQEKQVEIDKITKEVEVNYYFNDKLLFTEKVLQNTIYHINYVFNEVGYTFNKWLDKNGNEYSSHVILENEDIFADAVLTKYFITFDSSGGSKTDTITGCFGDVVIKPIPTKVGYRFIGWFEENCDSEYEFLTIELRNVYLTAVWEVLTTSVYLDPNGGVVEFNTLTLTYNELLDLPVPKKDGHTFLYWEYNGKEVESGVWLNTEESATFIAKYVSKIIKFELDANGGNLNIISGVIEYGSSTEKIKNLVPIKQGYEFICWTYNGIELDNYFNYLPNEFSDSVVLVAKYKKIKAE